VIALKVAQAAIADGVAVPLTDEQIQSNIEKEFWQPEYRTYKRVPF
jgi:malate dehydrogenase (oxaloacetate-decarboxylating)